MRIIYTCFRCGHEWLPRKPERPRRCGRCKSPYWDRPRKGDRGETHILNERAEAAV